MEEEETVSILSRKELRKQKLTEYLAEKGRLKQPNPRPYLHNDYQSKKTQTTSQKDFKGKENEGPSVKTTDKIRKVTTSGFQAIKPTNNKMNVKSNILAERQNSRCPSASGRSAKTNTGLTGPKTLPSHTSCNAVGQFKLLSIRKMQSCNRFSSSASVGINDHSGSTAAIPLPGNQDLGRVNLGPLVKTKTGLIPAVTHPRKILKHNNNAHPTTFCKTADSVAANKLKRNTFSVPVSQKCTLAQRTSRSVTSVNKPVSQRVTSSAKGADGAVRDPDKSHSKPPMGKSRLSCKGPLLSGFQHVPPKAKAAPPKSLAKGRIPDTKMSGRAFADKSSLHRSGVNKEKNMLRKDPNQKCFENERPKKYKDGATAGKKDTASAEPRERLKTTKDAQTIKTQFSANASKSRAEGNRTRGPVMSGRVSRPAKSICLTGPPVGMKTPKVPVTVVPKTEVKKLTAAQEERMRKLQEWREAKGISYKRPAMPVKPPVKHAVEISQPFWTAMKEEDDAHSLISAVDRSLDDCIKLLKEGCPPDQVKQVLSRLPTVSQKFAKYWICQVRLMEQEANLDVLPVFEEAVRVVLEPVDELRTVVFEILKKKDTMPASEDKEKGELRVLTLQTSPENSNEAMMTPKPGRVLLTGERGASSVVKYKVTATPSGLPSQKGKSARLDGQVIRFLTPVRRSVRIERASLLYPGSLQDHDVCVSSFKDLMSEEEGEKKEEENEGDGSPSARDTPMYIYRQNDALEDRVSVQLVYD